MSEECYCRFRWSHPIGVEGCRIQTKSTTEVEGEAKRVDENTHTEGGRISAVAAELMDTLIKKNADYAGGQEFFNFEQAAEFAGLDTFYVMLAQIGIKYTRIANLHGGDMPENESLRDSLVDLAGYAVIAAAWLDAVQAED